MILVCSQLKVKVTVYFIAVVSSIILNIISSELQQREGCILKKGLDADPFDR